jgi:DNA polymerase-3 subunit alpha
MVDDFIDRKHGRARVEYPHPDLEPILKPTYGVILYQEQVMQIAQVLANYTLGGADLLRRAMGKKKAEEMAEQRAIFTKGAVARGVEAQVATFIFDLMEKFAGYGFNKSHSAAYALIAYQTAWLKAHYPAAFMAAVMSSDMDNTDKVVSFIHECAQMNLKVLPPSVNHSTYYFEPQDEKTIIYGLGAIKGVGEAAIQGLVDVREADGVYTGLVHLCQRIDMRKINRRVLEALILSGSMDDFGIERSVLFASVDKAMQTGACFHHNQNSGQIDLFALLDDDESVENYVSCKAWDAKTRLDGEKKTLGLYLTGHPSDGYLQELAAFIQPIDRLNPVVSKKVTVCGLITQVRQIVTKRGKKLAIIRVENARAGIDVVTFSELFESKQALISLGQIVVMDGELASDDYNGGVKMTATALYAVDEARTRFAKHLTLTLTASDEMLLSNIKALLSEYKGRCVVQIHYENASAAVAMNLGVEWCVTPNDALLRSLRDILGETRVHMYY